MMAEAMETTNNTGTTVRSLMESFERGEIDFPTLLSAMTEHVCAEGPPRPKDWGEVWDRAEEMPDDDDPFWIRLAGDIGILDEEQEEQIYAALAHC